MNPWGRVTRLRSKRWPCGLPRNEGERVSTLIVLLPSDEGDITLGPGPLKELAELGVTRVSVFRDSTSVGITLEGWAFQPQHQAARAAQILGAQPGTRMLHQVAEVAVEPALTGRIGS